MNKPNASRITVILLLSALHGAVAAEAPSASATGTCVVLQNVEGTYRCSGECAVQIPNSAKLQVIQVQGEEDRVRRVPGSAAELFQIEIRGGKDFRELESGPLVGNVLYTATVEVSDQKYPVIEEYIFQTQNACIATGFTKVVRGLLPGSFKSCVLRCVK